MRTEAIESGVGLPGRVDLRGWLPGVVDQGSEPLCSSIAVTGMAEYLHRRRYETIERASVLFNYRTARQVAGAPNRRGSHVHAALRAWLRFGLARDEQWPLVRALIDEDPPAAVFRTARSWRADGFVELTSGPGLLDGLRAVLAAELPVTADFPLHLDLAQSFPTGLVTAPRPAARLLGRHAVLLCGYADDHESGGAFLVRNCWGTGWGEDGYGWLPYDLVVAGIVRCAWTVEAVPGWRSS